MSVRVDIGPAGSQHAGVMALIGLVGLVVIRAGIDAIEGRPAPARDG